MQIYLMALNNKLSKIYSMLDNLIMEIQDIKYSLIII